MEDGASTSQPHRLGRPRRLGHLELLVSLGSLLVIQSFLHSTTIAQRSVFNLLFIVVVISGVRMLSASRLRLFVAMGLSLIALVCSFATELYASDELIVTTYCCYIAIFLLLIVTLAEDVFIGGDVDSNRIIGAVCIFFILGLLWAFIYALVYIFDRDSFRFSNHVLTDNGIRPDALSEFIYFSNVTLTTLGYGDIVPISRQARVLATIEAMLGQLYLATVVARLVGLHISQRNRNTTPDASSGDGSD